MNRKFFYAAAVLVGSMVGVGVFGLPYTFARTGFWVGFSVLIIVMVTTLLTDLMYGEVSLRTGEKHQLLGYSRIYLDQIFQKLIFFSSVLMGYVAILAYIIISGSFLNTLLSGFFYVPVAAYGIFFALILSLVVLKGVRTVSHVELFFCGLFLAIVVLMGLAGLPHIQPENFSGFNGANPLLSYGILLFAFGGLIGVPIQRQILAGNERKLKKAIIAAVLFVGLLYSAFTAIVVGISGSSTSQDAVSGLYQFLGSKITILAAFFGIFAVTTSFLMHAAALVNTFHFDFKIRRFNAWVLAVLPPVLLFWGGIRSFIGIIGLAGGVALALEQIMIIFMYAKAKTKGDRVPEYSLNIPAWLLYVIIALLSIGIIYFLFIQ